MFINILKLFLSLRLVGALVTIIRIKVENFLVLYTICYLTIYSVEKTKSTENKSQHFIRYVYFSLSKNYFYGEANLMSLQKCA